MTLQLFPQKVSPQKLARAHLILCQEERGLRLPLNAPSAVKKTAKLALEEFRSSYSPSFFIEAFRHAVRELESKLEAPDNELKNVDQKVSELFKVKFQRTDSVVDLANQLFLQLRLRRVNYLLARKTDVQAKLEIQAEPQHLLTRTYCFVKDLLIKHPFKFAFIFGSYAVGLSLSRPKTLSSDFSGLKTSLLASSFILGTYRLIQACTKLLDPITNEQIDPKYLFHLNGKAFDAYSLIVALTRQDELRCPLSQEMLSQDQIKWLANILNIPVEDFQSVWQIDLSLRQRLDDLIKTQNAMEENPDLVKDLTEDRPPMSYDRALARIKNQLRFEKLCEELQSKNPGSMFAEAQRQILDSRKLKQQKKNKIKIMR